MKISLVIPNFNGESILRNNLLRIISAASDAEIIIVDDASTDGSVKVIENSKLKIIKNNKNMGFASAVNRGIEEASGDLIVLLNTDVIPEAGFLKAALPHFNDPKVFAVGFMQKCDEAGKIIFRGRGVGKFSRGFLIHSRGEVDKDDTLWVSGGAGVFRKKIWQTLGGMNPLYNPFYWEDIDICYRALKAGYKLVFERNSFVSHNQNKGAIRSTYTNIEINKIAYRNQIIFVWLNITDALFLIEHFLYLPVHLVRSIMKHDVPFLQGYFLSILKLREIFLYRNRYNKLIVKKDCEILN